MDPQEILRCLANRYSTCRSYSDRGKVEFSGRCDKREHLEFRTEFVRPSYFIFEWQDYGPRRGKTEKFSTLWFNGEKTIVHWIRTAVTETEKESLRVAVAGATGCSAGAAHKVPALLMDEVRADSKHLLLLTDVELIGEEVVDHHACYVLKGSLFKPGDSTMWVSGEDFGLRRLREDRSWTAEESERDHKILLANEELMARLKEKGIAPPENMEHRDTVFINDYFYSNVSFDAQIDRLPEPCFIE